MEGLIHQAGADSQAVPGAEVVLVEVAGTDVYRQLSDRAGRFRIVVQTPGRYRLTVSRVGYERGVVEDLHLEAGRFTRLTVDLEPRPVTLETLRVKATRSAPAEFWERKQRLGDQGHFLTPEYIQASYPRLGLILREVPGVHVGLANGSDSDISFSSPAGSGRCEPALYLNGLPLPSHPPLTGWVDASDIVGVEVYRSNSFAPEGYRATWGCGVILVWSRPSRPEGPGWVVALLLATLPYLVGRVLF